MRASTLLSSLTSISGVASLSIGNVERDAGLTGLQCKAIRNLVSNAGIAAQSTATAFCSSYLGIKTSTVLTTTTSISTSTSTILSTPATATFTASAITATSFATSTETDTTSTTVTSTVTTPGTGTTTIATPLVTCANPVPGGVKRAVAASPKPKPSCFKSITIGAQLSSACSCLSIPTPKSTSIVTVKGSTTISTTLNVLASATIAPSTTITSTITTTTTSTSSSTVTVTVPSTLSIVTVTGPFKMLASGGGDTNGHYGVRTPVRSGGESDVRFTGDISSASSYYLRADNALLDEQFLKLLAAGEGECPGYNANRNSGVNLICTTTAGPSCLLTCSQQSNSILFTGNYNVPNPYDDTYTPADWWGLGVDRAYNCFSNDCVYQKFDIYAVAGV
ncbi:hypothetical protein HII31_09126 [Pseudocercospora fuligena]|uniref:Ig-like domain-containing protein n=1 Tax=Pseudocercospora fuligena TaxID=685502 RepID=A0A8H6RG74_9PEZI|nr:hypothetical protein HII31_09126 [Pseudocercospora fuligena]